MEARSFRHFCRLTHDIVLDGLLGAKAGDEVANLLIGKAADTRRFIRRQVGADDGVGAGFVVREPSRQRPAIFGRPGKFRGMDMAGSVSIS